VVNTPKYLGSIKQFRKMVYEKYGGDSKKCAEKEKNIVTCLPTREWVLAHSQMSDYCRLQVCSLPGVSIGKPNVTIIINE